MTRRERFVRALTGQPVDRVPFIRLFGGDNAIVPQWEQEQPGIGNTIDEIIRFDGPFRGWQVPPVWLGPSQLGEPELLEKTEDREILRYADGSEVMVTTGGEDFHSQIIKWPVTSRADWERVKARHLDPDDPSRFPENWADLVAEYRTRDYPLQATHRGVYGLPRILIGDVNLGYLFYDDPALVHEIMEYCTDMTFTAWEKMLGQGVDFDLIEFWEDMASKNGSLVSPATFREFMTPHYRRVAEFARDHDIKVILVDSDGNIEGLTPLMLEAGVTALYPYEVQAGNDVAKMLDTYPTLGVIGGLDKNVMARGKPEIDREMEKARRLIRKGRFLPGPDHFVLSDVPLANYLYFMERLREVVMTTPPGAL